MKVRTAARVQWLAAVFASVTCLGLCGGVIAHADAPGNLTVSGDVRTPVTFTLDDLRSQPSQTQAVTFNTSSGPQSHVYVGCLVDALVTAAGPNGDAAAKHPMLTIAIVATGADGYAATLAWADIAPTLVPRPALVAWSEDGAPLDQPRLVLPGDLEGARYVSDLTDLRVVQLAQESVTARRAGMR